MTLEFPILVKPRGDKRSDDVSDLVNISEDHMQTDASSLWLDTRVEITSRRQMRSMG